MTDISDLRRCYRLLLQLIAANQHSPCKFAKIRNNKCADKKKSIKKDIFRIS